VDILLDSRFRLINSWNSCGLWASFAIISANKTTPIISGIVQVSFGNRKPLPDRVSCMPASFNLG